MPRLTLTTLSLALAISLSAAETIKFDKREAATVGVRVVEISTGRVVVEENSAKSMIPASILKSVTSASALLSLGEDFRFTTDVVYTGNLTQGKISGDLIVKAIGDPTISSRHFPEAGGICDSIVSALQRAGVTSIAGDLIVDESRFTDWGQNPQWVIEDVGWSYGAGTYGLNYFDNTFKYFTSDGRTEPFVPFVDVILEPSNASIDVTHGINSDNYIISGKDISKPSTFVMTPMNSPATVFVTALSTRLESAGIVAIGNGGNASSIEGSSNETLLYRHRSPRLGAILKSLMHRSDNMMAEATLRALSQGNSRKKAIETEMALWQNRGVNTTGVKIADGSGLARMDRVTPKFMTDVLVSMAKSAKGETYEGFFPLVGKEGTVKSLLKNTRLQANLALKSGSMNGVHCYAGYKLSTDGRATHAVVIIVNNFFCTRDALRRAIEQWLLEIF